MRECCVRDDADGLSGYKAPSASLPGDIAFLNDCQVDEEHLAAAAYRATRDGVSAARALMASGAISASRYYGSLARHLDLPFIEGWPLLAAGCDPVIALRRGRARLAADQTAAWLVAPGDDELALLLSVHRSGGMALPGIAITTPAHFCDVVRHATRAAIAEAASEALPSAAPHLSAKGAADVGIGLVAALCLLCCIVGLWVSAPVVVDLLGALFLVSMVCRLLVCGAGLTPPTEGSPTVSDGEAPVYTVLVPLFREVGMVPRLVAVLNALDYPRSKLEVLFLVEQNDARTREALFACGLPPGFRAVVVPNGAPQTKPRALNLGLMIARGEFVTVYDAEDRPDSDQLRKAAALFAVAPGRVACLQAKLAIANAGEGLLPRLFAIEYSALFDLFNVGVGRLGLPMALGGTSNHFRGMG